jgi:hypothetical protein
MKVRSALADLEIGIDDIRRSGNELVLRSAAGSPLETVISVSAREIVATMLKVLLSPSALLFVLGLPFFWLRQTFGPAATPGTATRAARPPGPVDINRPW